MTVSGISLGQSTTSDSLPIDQLRTMISESQGTERVELQLQMLKRMDASIDERWKIACDLETEFRDKNQPFILGQALSAKGSTLSQKGDLKEAVEILKEAEACGLLCAEANPEVFFVARSNRALFMQALQMDRQEIASLVLENIEFAKPFGNRLKLGHTYYTLAMLAESSGAIDKAIEYLKTGFDFATQADHVNVAGQILDMMVALLNIQGQFHLSKEWVERGKPWIERATDPRVRFSFTIHCEDLRVAEGEPEKAVKNLRELLVDIPSSIDQQMVGLVYLSIAAAESTSGNYEDAIIAADKGIELLSQFARSLHLCIYERLNALFGKGEYQIVLDEIAQQLPKVDPLGVPRIKLLELQSRAFEKLGRLEESLAAIRLSLNLEKKRLQNRSEEQMNFMTAVYNNKDREAKLQLLQETNRALETESKLAAAQSQADALQAKHAKEVRNIAIVVSFATVLSLGLLLYSHFYRRSALVISERKKELNERLTKQLADQEEALRSEVETRRKLELAIERKQRNEALGKLTGGVAHDFNNLLTVILNTNEIIRIKEPNLSPIVQEFLDSSTKAAQSGASIISQLLAYARQQPLTPKPTRVAHWLSGVKNLFQKTIGSSIKFMIEDASEDKAICIDSAQLTTCIINLLFNSKDAIKDGGTIEFRISLVDIRDGELAPWSEISSGRFVQFEVRDNGKGISAQELDHVCEPFYTTKGANAGTGLGLSSVLGFVKQSAGDLHIESKLNEGTVVRFVLPVCEMPDSTPFAIQSTGRPGKRRLLVVDDQDEVRLVTVGKLKMMGFEVAEANGADAAIQCLAQDNSLDVVLSDIRMPGSMNGIELRRWIGSHFPRIRVILMSGFSELAMEAGPDFLPKPFSQRDLEKALALETASHPA